MALTAGLALVLFSATGVFAQSSPPAARSGGESSRVPHAVPFGASDLGGMTLREYCQALGYTGATQDSGSPTGWDCFTGSTTVPLSTVQACRWQFRDLVAAGFAVSANGGDCFATNAADYHALGGLSPDRYCQSLGYTRSDVVEHTVVGWRCVPGEVQFDMHAACAWTNPGWVSMGYSVVSYFKGYGDTFGITCVALLR
jgi:hypothetical protein